MRTRIAAALLVCGFALAGCSGSDGNLGDTDPTSGLLPFPIDLYFAGSTDGTLDLPVEIAALTPHFAALNALDGWSTTADITVRFSRAIDPASRNLTRFNPVPAAGTALDIPLLLMVPNIIVITNGAVIQP